MFVKTQFAYPPPEYQVRLAPSYSGLQPPHAVQAEPNAPAAGGSSMRIAIIGQQDFGKATLEAFLSRGDTVSAVFCAPEKGRPDPLRVAAEERGVPVHQFPRLTDPAALEALRAAKADVGVMAYVTQFVPQDLCNIPTFGTIQFHPSLLPLHR